MLGVSVSAEPPPRLFNRFSQTDYRNPTIDGSVSSRSINYFYGQQGRHETSTIHCATIRSLRWIGTLVFICCMFISHFLTVASVGYSKSVYYSQACLAFQCQIFLFFHCVELFPLQICLLSSLCFLIYMNHILPGLHRIQK